MRNMVVLSGLRIAENEYCIDCLIKIGQIRCTDFEIIGPQKTRWNCCICNKNSEQFRFEEIEVKYIQSDYEIILNFFKCHSCWKIYFDVPFGISDGGIMICDACGRGNKMTCAKCGINGEVGEYIFYHKGQWYCENCEPSCILCDSVLEDQEDPPLIYINGRYEEICDLCSACENCANENEKVVYLGGDNLIYCKYCILFDFSFSGFINSNVRLIDLSYIHKSHITQKLFRVNNFN